MNSEIIEEIVELDRINMSEVIKTSGGEYSEDMRRSALKRELASGSQLLTYYRNGLLAGYLQYTTDNIGACYVISLQVHPEHRNGVVLRSLLKNFRGEIRIQNIKELKSSVHTNNKESVSLHERLGFRVVRTENERHQFSLLVGQ
ncbi:MAG: GNAT family N-acetyltransferase [Pseudohongiellaceae bacterium]|nr:GNAT family N-acetyltransferase [Pseudohongiellaceae bacterium]